MWTSTEFGQINTLILKSIFCWSDMTKEINLLKLSLREKNKTKLSIRKSLAVHTRKVRVKEKWRMIDQLGSYHSPKSR